MQGDDGDTFPRAPMTTGAPARHTSVTDDLIDAARAGSESAFTALTTPHRRELHVHCYRMLGSFEDAEDAVQETFLRAWTRLSTFAGTSTFRAWLYAIATNVCLDALRRRKSRVWPTDVTAATAPRNYPSPPQELPWLEPYPSHLLGDSLDGAEPSAESVVASKETIELAFLAAIQHLPARQRAVLILRDVLEWPAKDTAEVLGMTAVAVNSALQRAHATLTARMPERDEWTRGSSTDDRVVLDQLIAAWERADTDALVALLAPDARYVMPPRPSWFAGRDDIAAFFRDHVFDELGADWRLVPTGANGQPAFGLYIRRAGEAGFTPFGVGVVQCGPRGIEEIALFMDNPRLFDQFALPAVA